MKLLKLIFFVLFVFIYSCSKDTGPIDEVNTAPIADFTYSDNIDELLFTEKCTDKDGDKLTYKWICSSDVITLSGSTSSSCRINLPNLTTSIDVTIQLTVSDGLEENSTSKVVTIPEMTDTRKIGLGHEIVKEKSNNVNYNFYFDQGYTGTHSDVNCGPTTVTMAIKWANESFDKIPEDARSTYNPEGGWWFTNDIINYLDKYSINNKTIALPTANVIMDEIDNGNVAIICLDMYYISNGTKSTWHVDKFYQTSSTGWGHFILLKGYKKVDNNYFFEVYDPNCYGQKYSDNTLKGIDRYYRLTDIEYATKIWWPNAIIVSRNPFTKSDGLDVSKLKHQYGM